MSTDKNLPPLTPDDNKNLHVGGSLVLDFRK